MEDKSIKIEKRTIEELLVNLRTEKNWTYLDVVQELSKINIFINEKTIKKWEIGLIYPDTNIIYKLSELYLIPSTDFITAKNNSYAKGYQSIHKTFIKWFCYITGFSMKICYIITYAFSFITLIGAFMFFINKCTEFVGIR